MVVANTRLRPSPIFVLTAERLAPILSTIVSCSEWRQTILHEGLLGSFRKHSNPAFLIGAVLTEDR
jgi:hypothetical protein